MLLYLLLLYMPLYERERARIQTSTVYQCIQWFSSSAEHKKYVYIIQTFTRFPLHFSLEFSTKQNIELYNNNSNPKLFVEYNMYVCNDNTICTDQLKSVVLVILFSA